MYVIYKTHQTYKIKQINKTIVLHWFKLKNNDDRKIKLTQHKLV